jgi:methionyl aminopeptidase
MLYYKTDEEIELLRESSQLVSKTLAEIAKVIGVGVKGKALDKIAEEFILDNGALPGFKGFNNYKYTLCISVNDEVVHGLPSDVEFKNGDIVSVDCGVLKNGFYGDSAFTFAVGEVKNEVLNLLKTTRECLEKAILEARPGRRIGDIGAAVQKHAEANGYSVVRELVGHGIGKNLHEKPEVPNYGRNGTGSKLQKGLVIAVEPMINMGIAKVKYDRDGWTVRTADKMPSAHFEHSIAIGKEKADVLSSFEPIDEVLRNKKN